MTSVATNYGVSILAGLLSTLSPCVLPLVPILMGSAVATHRMGGVALAGGVALSFTLVGILIASVGASLGIDADLVRPLGAVVMVVLGAVLLSHRLQQRFAALASGPAGAGNALLARLSLDGLAGQFALGLLLGLVWTPCVGPTLGAAVTLASQRLDLPAVALQMAMFGLGASLPLLLIGSLSRAALPRTRTLLRVVSDRGRQLLGAMLVLLGVLILTRIDRNVEGWLVAISPSSLTTLTTRY
jgi:cytochrome c-type biogenesis protein